MKAESFQDPSAPMKRALFLSLALGAVAVIMYMFFVSDYRDKLQDARARHDKERDRYDSMVRMEAALKKAGQDKDRTDPVKVVQDYQKKLLEPLLESYAMRAKSLLDPHAKAVGMTIVDYAELPTRRLPLPPNTSPVHPPKQLYARKPIRLTCTGSYARIVSFILRVEEKMPHVSIEAFSLKSQNDPDVQSATIVCEWPIKGETFDATAVKGGVKR